ncbi:DUF2141 domain-containing protein [Thalassotalea sp. ND16A]|uniref:DUF2141 domain-containing protein n=1 Tax=Thalassotalea sp. ND16A TaxID=1535422 RepID=UPI00051A529D|nr:DUF2141 domain-containing protein [Thalassotalea sp. ND16A]KGJ95708.1 hypothetical protein ND16A_1243 [Thalassotalea sp. ND16A]
MNSTTLLFATITSLLLTTTTYAGEVEFNIDGVNDDSSKLYVQIFKGEENYQNGNAESATITKAKNGKASISFKNLDKGDYALRFFHDQNNNGKLETNLFGMPVEGYGFSNNAKPNFGPVSYQQIKFSVSDDVSKVVNESTVIY